MTPPGAEHEVVVDFMLAMNRRVFRVAADRIRPDPAPGLS
jgi:hypothetical protein